MKRPAPLAVALFLVTACGGPPSPTPDMIGTQVAQAQAVAATLTTETLAAL
jgi:hypothetical protein